MGNSLRKKQSPAETSKGRVAPKRFSEGRSIDLLECLFEEVLALTDSEVAMKLGIAVRSDDALKRVATAAAVGALLAYLEGSVPAQTEGAVVDLRRQISKRASQSGGALPDIRITVSDLRNFLVREAKKRSRS